MKKALAVLFLLMFAPVALAQEISSPPSSESQWIRATNDIYYNSGNVGIGTATPGASLQVVGGQIWSESARVNYNLYAYAAGTAYSLTATPALIDFGTTDPSLTIDKAGTYLLMGRAYLKYNGATYTGTQTATIKLRRTNNSAADVSNATTTATMRIITTITDTVGIMEVPSVIYTTSNTDDTIQVFGSVSATPAAGSVDVTEASILAIRLY